MSGYSCYRRSSRRSISAIRGASGDHRHFGLFTAALLPLTTGDSQRGSNWWKPINLFSSVDWWRLGANVDLARV